MSALGLLRDHDVGVEGARIAVEILAGAELQGVDEDGDDDLPVGAHELAGGADEGGVALVQGTHRHHDGAAPGGRRRQFPGRAGELNGH
ncbi:hypothetical protein GCM10020000_36500 [Streptomyces olivoverticillatus]